MDNKYTFSIILIICNYLLTTSNGDPLLGKKVKPAEENEFPFVVSLGYFVASKRSERYLNHFCGGSLITQRHVLTAAHCLEKEVPRNVAVTVGNVDLNEGRIYTIESWITYDEWNMKSNLPKSFWNDIAVVTLSSNITDIVPAVRSNLSDTDIYSRKAVLAGWGSMNNDLIPQFLHKSYVRVLTMLECKSNVFMLFGSLKPMHSNHYCTSAQPPVIVACGDSGGPLLLKDTNEIIGVNSASSFNVKNAVKNRYATSIHIKVNYFKEFIDDVSKMNE